MSLSIWGDIPDVWVLFHGAARNMSIIIMIISWAKQSAIYS